MKALVCTMAFLAAGIVFAQDAATQAAADKAAQRAKDLEEELRETGGYLDYIPVGPMVMIADARKMPDAKVPARVESVVEGMFKLPATNVMVALKEGDCHIAKAEALRKDTKSLMAIMLVNAGEKMPSLTVCPEERVAVVNADKTVQFAKGDEADIRLIKEIWRGFGFIAGAGYSQNDASVMQPISSALELDAIEWQVVHPLALQQMNKFLKKYGAVRGRRTTYKRALEQGWISTPPTNDYQKAIFAKVRAEKAAATEAKPAEAK